MSWKIINTDKYSEIMKKYNVSSLSAKVFLANNTSDQDIKNILNPHLVYNDYDEFKDANKIVARINKAITTNEKTCVYGDYDCDGILATSILVKALKMRGLDAKFHIPSRTDDGYGLNVKRVIQMYEKGYTLIITVDNGVKAFEAIDKANELGMDVIVTDHHDFDKLPNAYAILHAKLNPDYPCQSISGGFTAYKLASKLLGKHDKYLYSLAAITTISDMMPLIDENRSLVLNGLKFMNENHFRTIDLIADTNSSYNTTTIGFNIAPKINSFGRLSNEASPNKLVLFFMGEMNESYNIEVGAFAKKLNEKRKYLTTKAYDQAMADYHEEDDFLFVANQNIAEGLVGLVAGKFTSSYNRPSFVMLKDTDSNTYHGSARGVDNARIPDIFNYCKDDLIQYGGHSYAGGFSLESEKIESFKNNITSFLDSINFKVEENMYQGILVEDKELSLTNIKDLSKLEPFGNGNDEPLFILKDQIIANLTPLSNGKHLKIMTRSNQTILMFNVKELDKYKINNKIDIIFKVSINNFMNKESVNLIGEEVEFN
ncbi:MAG: single-stranded-DNA-specific exonuclease RecJ [Thomasclavelia sp.]|nr:single-stranded-DNA-specific exonuclease RecJ [Thomasclavelia sp.]